MLPAPASLPGGTGWARREAATIGTSPSPASPHVTSKGQPPYVPVRATVCSDTAPIRWGCCPCRCIRNRMAHILIRRRLTEIWAPGRVGGGGGGGEVWSHFPAGKLGPRGGHPPLQGQRGSKKASSPGIAPLSSPSPRLRVSFHSPKSSVGWVGATAPFMECAQSHTARPRGQEFSPAPTAQGMRSWPRAPASTRGSPIDADLLCGRQCTTSHFSSQGDNRGTERLGAAPKATQPVGYRAKTQSWVF